MGSMGEILLTVVVVVGFTAILTLFQRRKQASSWQGTVTKIEQKQIERNRLEDGPAIYEEQVWIRYRTDGGKRGKLQLTPQQFEQHYAGLVEGCRLNKEAGEALPERLEP